MNADTFTNELRLLAPSAADLAHWNMSSNGVEGIRNGYFATRVTTSSVDDPLVDLCTNFNINTLEIGIVTFCRPEDFSQELWQIGEFETDPIVVPKLGGKVCVRDHEDLTREVCLCAKDSDSFLSALLIAAKFFTRRLVATRDAVGTVDAESVLGECVSLVGGKNYESFFRVLLGE